MKYRSAYTGWLLGGMMMLLLIACGRKEEEAYVAPRLQIHVYTPEHPVVTRADIGGVSSGDEGKVTSLHIWVFRHDTGESVGYLNPTGDNLQNGGTYLMDVTDEFAKTKPNVDVYVVANVTDGNCGSCGLYLDSKNPANLTRDSLEAAKIGEGFFGLNSQPTGTVPDDGLPMSGVLKNQALGGSSPVLSVGRVTVVRAVSKVRFVFSRAQADDTLKINKITFDDKMIPKQEFLFLDGAYEDRKYHIADGGYYGETPLSEPGIDVPSSADPGAYVYTGGQSGQEYESLINGGLTKGELKDVGPFYLKESDKKITGKICYQIGGGPEKTAVFEMKEAGDFSRNHTWIVYAYFAGSDKLDVLTVTFVPWSDAVPDTHQFYNW